MQFLTDLELLNRIARALKRRLPRRVEISELINDGYLGLHAARLRFIPWLGVPFPAYARKRIVGAMLDGLRQRDWVPRRLRNGAGASPTPAALDDCCLAREDPSPQRIERREQLLALLQRLPASQRRIAKLYGVEGLSMKQIADKLAISESAVSQRISRLSARLRRSEFAQKKTPRSASAREAL